MLIEVQIPLPTKHIMERILLAFRDGNRVIIFVDPSEADSLITRLRMMKTRGLKRVAAQGKLHRRFLLRAKKIPWTSIDGTRKTGVLFWEEVTETQRNLQDFERILLHESH